MACPACKSNVSESVDYISCMACKNTFHLNCVGVNVEYQKYYINERKRPWYCSPCYVDTFALKEDVKKMVTSLSKEFHHSLDLKLTKVAHEIMGMYQQQMLTIVNEKDEVLRRDLSETRDDVEKVEERVKV